MSSCQKLWSLWFIIYLVVINTYLTVVSIKDYLNFKYQIFDIAYGGDWNTGSIYLILGCLNTSLALLPLILYTSIIPQNNLANDGHILGKDPDVFHLSVNEHGKGNIVPTSNKKLFCLKNPSICLIFMELPPFSYLLNVISAMCFFIPKAFIDGQRIKHGVLGSHVLWHSDLDFVFFPDQQHSEFVHYPTESYVQPVSVAYFNLGLSLVLLSLQYSRVLWNISRKYTVLLSTVMIFWSTQVLIECCSIAVMIKISLNSPSISEEIQLSISEFHIQFLSIAGNVVLLLSFTSLFHYGVLQYADTMIQKSRKSRRLQVNCSPHLIGSNHLNPQETFSPCISENNYSESSIEAVFSKSHSTHIFAIACLVVSTTLKSTNLYQSFVHLYQTTSDTLTLVNFLLNCLYVVFWLFLWFALALRRNWNFDIKSDQKFNCDTQFLNSNSGANHSGMMQLRQMHNSLLRNGKPSDINLSKQDIMVLNRNIGLDGGSDETDMSSSNNYVFLQSMRNGQSILHESNGQQSMLRNPLYLPYSLNNQAIPNSNMLYANDDTIINNRQLQFDEQLDSEHSFNSNRSRNNGFENLPPILPNLDESRYRNPNPVSMEKLIPRYLRNQSLDYNNFVHFSMPNNEIIYPSVISTAMSFPNENGIPNHNTNSINYNHIIRYKQIVPNNLMRPIDKYSTLQTSAKSSLETMDLMIPSSDDDINQRRLTCGNDSMCVKSLFDPRRVVKSPVMCSTLEESITDNLTTDSECLLPLYIDHQEQGQGVTNDNEDHCQQTNVSNNDDALTVADRMCSQV